MIDGDENEEEWKSLDGLSQANNIKSDLLHHWQALYDGKFSIIHSLSTCIYRTENREHIRPFLYQKITSHLTSRSRGKEIYRDLFSGKSKKVNGNMRFYSNIGIIRKKHVLMNNPLFKNDLPSLEIQRIQQRTNHRIDDEWYHIYLCQVWSTVTVFLSLSYHTQEIHCFPSFRHYLGRWFQMFTILYF